MLLTMTRASAGQLLPSHQPTLFGRENENVLLQRLLAQALEPRGQVLVLRGEGGIGKTALLDELASSASGWRVARTGGVEADVELAYGGIQQLCGPLRRSATRSPPHVASAAAARLTVSSWAWASWGSLRKSR
jgi:hypothetical protein